MLSGLNDKNKVVGSKQAKRFLAKDAVSSIYIAKDADRKVTDELIQIANEKSVEVIFIDSMKELGEACEIDVNAATVAILK
ncbi:ribosomal L7Ae/L30e/S12e/Gadd45 family protein [Clostridium sp. D2Q-11]|uniref:Ribosomal L7Ae/L30e/S12e/Gadd45 family protein n=1 Tax=Anaeromonas frigoriresistens TaxID=2683708 RepID=A0A942USY7_9FIRM|nr:ribosomal L7Ae/L30e/S12e/Gadd45 family protein [Anaeromonas frigoriresistens]MBS4538003.1 ribosomal L7Ae/L30e/S12e/Gadd45 family protein [Anaeromonas frigoriresistens]